jgi:deoxyribonuclease-1-like protein
MKLNHIILLLFLSLFSFSSCESRSGKKNIRDNFLITVYKPEQLDRKNAELRKSKSSELTVLTWNIQNLGQSKNNEEIDFIVNVLKDYDVVAIQEVVGKHPAGAQKVAQIADELNRKGAKWDYRISNPTKSPSVHISERYAFLWKTSKVAIQGKAFLDNELASVINREPYIAKFKSKKNGITFHIINFHARTNDEHPEREIIHFKDYPERLETDQLIIAGDFNLNERHEVWDNLYQQGFKPSIRREKTTLKRKCASGDYLSHDIDNIYYSKKLNQVNSGVVDFIQNCENLTAARLISDHLPVFTELAFN